MSNCAVSVRCGCNSVCITSVGSNKGGVTTKGNGELVGDKLGVVVRRGDRVGDKFVSVSSIPDGPVVSKG